jgi:hypothetical protein
MAGPGAVPVTANRPLAASRAMADQAVPENTARADQADQAVPENTARVDRADQVVQANGMAIPAAATSTELPGATDPHPGDGVSRRGRCGADRSRGPEGHG